MAETERDATVRRAVTAMRMTPWKLSPVVTGAITVAVTLVVIALVTGTHYETIDDALMNAIAAGKLISDVPDEHLVYTTVLIGLPLKLAYRFSRETPWYGLYLLTSLAVAAAGFLWAFGDVLRSWRGRVLVLTLLVGTVSTTLNTLQYTRVAFLLVESGWVLVAGALARRLPWHRAAGVVGGVLVLLGTCVRAEIGMLGTVLCAPLMLAALAEATDGRPWRTPARTAVLPAAIVIACVLAVGLDRAYYRAQPSWREFLVYHRTRTGLMGTVRGQPDQISPAVLAHIGWSANDLSVMYSYFGVNETVFSLERQQYIIDHGDAWRWPFDGRSAKDLQAVLSSHFVLLFGTVALGALALAGGARSAGSVLGSVVLLVCVIGTLAANWKLPERFFEPALSVPAATALALLAWRRTAERPTGRIRSLISAFVCGAALLLAGRHLRQARQVAGDNEEDNRTIVSALAALHPDRTQLYVAWGGDFPYNAVVTPLGGFAGAGDLQLFPAVWTNHLPLLRPRLIQFGIGDIHTALWQMPNVFLISSRDRCARLAEFLAVHYGPLVGCQAVSDQLSIYKVTAATRRGPSINVRWQASVSTDERLALETRYGLQRPRALENRTWRYELANPTGAILAGLVHDPRVEDTAGLDRQTGDLVRPQPDW